MVTGFEITVAKSVLQLRNIPQIRGYTSWLAFSMCAGLPAMDGCRIQIFFPAFNILAQINVMYFVR
jgi:hypothetical protein